MDITELLGQEYIGRTTVINCMVHMDRNIMNRPNDCGLCLADIKNVLNQAISMNNWLNQWKEDATVILEQCKDEKAENFDV